MHLNRQQLRHFVEPHALAAPYATSFNRTDISTAEEERMGRRGTGVEVCGNARRIQFSLNGEVVRRTLRRDSTPVPPSEENLGEAKRLAAEIRSRIAAGTFCHSEYFPATRKDGKPLTVGEHLDVWLAVQRIEPSTAAAYASAVRFWKCAPCDDKGSLLGERAPFPDPFTRDEVEAIIE